MAQAGVDSRSQAETLVRARYYEGMPFDTPKALDQSGIQRLAEMIEDPREQAHRSNIVMALGLSNHPDAFKVLRAYSERTPKGRIQSSERNARLALPIALGHLSRTDSRAYKMLEQQVMASKPVGWHDKRFNADRLSEMLHRTRIQAIGISGASEGADLLRVMIKNTDDPGRKNIMREALDLSNRVQTSGAARVFERVDH